MKVKSNMKINSIWRTQIIRLMSLALFALCFSQTSARAQEQTRQVTLIQEMVALTLTPGQTLRASLLNAGEVDSGAAPVRLHVKVFDGRGHLLAQTDEVEVEAGTFHSYDIAYADLDPTGAVRGKWLQVTVKANVVIDVPGREHATGFKARIDKLPASLELVDDDSGKAVLMLLPAVQKVREAASR